MKRIKEKATDMEDRQKTSNLCLTGVPTKKKTKARDNKKIIQKNLSEI